MDTWTKSVVSGSGMLCSDLSEMCLYPVSGDNSALDDKITLLQELVKPFPKLWGWGDFGATHKD